MKTLIQISLLIVILCTSCQSDSDAILGTWHVKSNYYKATYKIAEENGAITGTVLYYNDGTSIITSSDSAPRYVFKNLIKKDNQFVDAVSGATITNENEKFSLQLIDSNTIETTSYLRNKPLKEIWKRK